MTTPALLPVALIGMLCWWSGTLVGAATAEGAVGSYVAILAFSLVALPSWRDPLRLGTTARWLLPALLAAVLASWWASPVRRAGSVALILLPAALLVAPATARCWHSRRAQRWGVDGLSVLVLVTGLIALASWRTLALPRAALPLGHHRLLAGWLVLVLPLALLPVREAGWRRLLGGLAGLIGGAALMATGSLLGAVALVSQALVAARWWPRLRPGLIVGGLAALIPFLPRLERLVQGLDPSALARSTYLAAGWRGFLERPLVGRGPGSVPWTIASFVEPDPAFQPASEIVGDLHSLPVQLAYELGAVGLLLVALIAASFMRRRLREAADSPVPVLQRAGLLGLLGGAVFLLGSAPLAVPALPVTLAVVAGISMSPLRPPSAGTGRAGWALWGPYWIAAGLLLSPLTRAHLLYDRARYSGTPEIALSAITRARQLDPSFPLYHLREAWLASDLEGASPATADRARTAAVAAGELAPLWLAAAELGRLADRPWTSQALERAWRLDPLSPVIAFHRMADRAGRPEAVDLGIRALRGEPRLAGAELWRRHPELAAKVAAATNLAIPPGESRSSPEALVLGLTLDRDPAVSFSLYAFRRAPWPRRFAAVRLTADPDAPKDPELE